MHGNVGGMMAELGRLGEAGVHLLYAKKVLEERYGEESRELETVYTDLKRLYRLQNRQDEVLRYTRKLTRISAL